MKLFISWSGSRSKAVAEAFYEWLPAVIHAVKPWFSPDMDKGSRWNTEISGQLQNSNFGLICLTAENLNSPWILFEAGALSKTLEKTFVCPYLLDIGPDVLRGPLAQFQSTKFNRDDTKKLLETINNTLGSNSLSQKILDAQFEKWWPDLEEKF